MGIPHTRTQSIDMVAGKRVVPGMNALVPIPTRGVPVRAPGGAESHRASHRVSDR